MNPTQEPSPSASSGSEWIVDADARTFESEVLARSLEVPVLLDFWATWCGPCKTLGPELERQARQGRGRFLLARIDIDRNPELAQAFRVQAVPTVLAIAQGRLVDGFQGALPPAELEEFLARVAPVTSGPSRIDVRIASARELAERGETEAAIGHLREILREVPDHAEARMALAEVLIDAGKHTDARLVIEKLEGDQVDPERIQALRARLSLSEAGDDLAELEASVRADPSDLGARVRLARARIAAGDRAKGLEELLEVVRADAGEHRAEAKKTMLEVFQMLGLEDPLANEYRFKLSLELFS